MTCCASYYKYATFRPSHRRHLPKMLTIYNTTSIPLQTLHADCKPDIITHISLFVHDSLARYVYIVT